MSTRRRFTAAAAAMAGSMAVIPFRTLADTDTTRKHRKLRILHVMSYHSPWRWTDGQLEGFRQGLGEPGTEYRVFQMDTKRNSTAEAKERVGREARALIDAWKPDLVYTTDDDVQEHVAKHYVNRDLPFVFSGVNKDPAAYGFRGSRNITGVLEHEHFVESVRLLRTLVPGMRRIAVVLDDAPMWDPVGARMRAGLKSIPEVEVTAWDVIRTWQEFQARMKAYATNADAVALIGIFNFKDERGRNVPYQDVLRWTAENSRLPDLGFWIDRVTHGTLAAVTVSEHEQGLAAGRIARAILIEGRAPMSIEMKPTVKGTPVINLARANQLGLKVTSSVLLASEVVSKYEWDVK